MQIDWWTLGLQTVNALVLIWLLGHFSSVPWPTRSPVVGRRLARCSPRQKPPRRRRRANGTKPRRKPHASRTIAQRGFQGSGSRGCGSEIGLLVKAQAEADKLRAAGKAEIEAGRRAEELAAEDGAARLAVDIAAKLLDRLPREARVSAFIDGIATGLAKLPEVARASVGADGNSIHLTIARAVTPQEEGPAATPSAGVLGHPVALEVSVDPALIAGIELEAPHAAVSNSFRADLIRLKSELVHHDTNHS